MTSSTTKPTMNTAVTAVGIVLNGVAVVRVKRGPYLVGYFTTPAQVEQALRRRGLTLADVSDDRQHEGGST